MRPTGSQAARAAAAEQAITHRHLRGLPWPGKASLGLAHWPPAPADRAFASWHYWWQAHLAHTLVEACAREPSPLRRARVGAVRRGIRARNGGRWLNRYYDDIAWLGIACQHGQAQAGVPAGGAIETIATRLRAGWSSEARGGIYWRRCTWLHRLIQPCDFKNTPATGAAAVFFAGRPDDRGFAAALLDWLAEYLLDERSGLLADGVQAGSGELVRAVFTYNQGLYLGACAELHAATGEEQWRHRAKRTIGALRHRLVAETEHGPVLRGQGGGDGGLFAGILARHLARAAVLLGDSTAAELVFSSAEAAWANAASAGGGPLFGPEWHRRARMPSRGPRTPERDLSVQLSGWMLLEAAGLLERTGVM
jgi:predicted alpha-1,6-mannanase (GH76 family)